MKKNEKILIIVLIIFLLLLLVFGILYGGFRMSKKLSKEELDEINKIKDNPPVDISSLPSEFQNPHELFSKLWKEHVARTREFILADLHSQSDLQAKEDTLMQNQEDIGNAVDKYFPGSKDLVTKLFKEHISIAKDIVEDLKFNRFGRISSDINKWYSNADEISEVLKAINDKWHFRSHMREHLRITEREALYEWMGANNISLDIYNSRIIPNAQEMAQMMADGILEDHSTATTSQRIAVCKCDDGTISSTKPGTNKCDCPESKSKTFAQGFPSNPKNGQSFVKDGISYTWMCIQLNPPPYDGTKPATCDWYKDEYIRSLNLTGK